MLDGVVKFPPEYAKRYRARGYWKDKALATEFAAVFERFADRLALIDGERRFTYADVDRQSDNLARNLTALGFKPLDRVVLQLPNVAEFVILYFALQKIGAIPIAALSTHRYSEVSQFVDIAQAVACVYPERQGDFAFGPMVARVADASPCLEFRIVLGTPGAGELSLTGPDRAAGAAPTTVRFPALRPTRKTPASSSSRAAPPACPSSFRARTMTTPTTPRPPRRCAGSPAIPYCC